MYYMYFFVCNRLTGLIIASAKLPSEFVKHPMSFQFTMTSWLPGKTVRPCCAVESLYNVPCRPWRPDGAPVHFLCKKLSWRHQNTAALESTLTSLPWRHKLRSNLYWRRNTPATRHTVTTDVGTSHKVVDKNLSERGMHFLQAHTYMYTASILAKLRVLLGLFVYYRTTTCLDHVVTSATVLLTVKSKIF